MGLSIEAVNSDSPCPSRRVGYFDESPGIVKYPSQEQGGFGYFAAKAGDVELVGSLAHQVPAAKQVVFLADLWAHLTAYGIGLFGGIGVSIWVLGRRWRLARGLHKSL
ncbi:MAG: hypothetical protein ACLP9L_32675 [Thermoguttaceae bacterium]